MIVDVVQVVQNHEQSLAWITAAAVADGFDDVQDPFATTKQTTESVVTASKQMNASLHRSFKRSRNLTHQNSLRYKLLGALIERTFLRGET